MSTITTSQLEELDQASKVLEFIIKMNRDIIQDFKSGLGPDSQDPAATFAEMSSGAASASAVISVFSKVLSLVESGEYSLSAIVDKVRDDIVTGAIFPKKSLNQFEMVIESEKLVAMGEAIVTISNLIKE